MSYRRLIPLSSTLASLSKALVLTDGGHAIAALVPIDDADLESMALSLSPKFQAVIKFAREEHRNGAACWLTTSSATRGLRDL